MDKEQFHQSLYSALDESDGFEHHGVKGMHWGVRKRAVNTAPSRRQQKKQAKEKAKSDKKEIKAHVSKLNDMAKHSYQLSDQELASTVNRLRLESQLKQEVARTAALDKQYTNPYKYTVSKAFRTNLGRQALQSASQQTVKATGKGVTKAANKAAKRAAIAAVMHS